MRLVSSVTSSTPSRSNPRFTSRRFERWRTNNPATLSSTTASATCATTSPRPKNCRDRVSPAEPPSRKVVLGAHFRALRAGARLNRIPATTATPAANRSTEASTRTWKLAGSIDSHSGIERPRSHQRVSADVREQHAGKTAGTGQQQRFGQELPHQPQSSCAERDPRRHSRRRAAARASSNPARFVQVISRIVATIAISTSRGRLT